MSLPEQFTLKELANWFKVPERKLRDILKQHSVGVALGTDYRFTEQEALTFRENLPCPYGSTNVATARTGTSAAPSEAKLWTKARALATENGPKRSASNGNPKSSTVVSMARTRRQPS